MLGSVRYNHLVKAECFKFSPGEAGGKRNEMEIGMFTSGYQRNPLEHCFIDAKRFGYDYIELWGGRPHAFAFDLKAGDINEVRRMIDKYEMPVRGYTPEHNGYPYNFMIGSEAMRQDAVEYLKLSMDMAKEMDADFTLMSPAHAGYGATYEEIWNRLEKTMKELVYHAEKIGHKIVMETLTPYESNVVRSANDLVELFHRVEFSLSGGHVRRGASLCIKREHHGLFRQDRG